MGTEGVDESYPFTIVAKLTLCPWPQSKRRVCFLRPRPISFGPVLVKLQTAASKHSRGRSIVRVLQGCCLLPGLHGTAGLSFSSFLHLFIGSSSSPVPSMCSLGSFLDTLLHSFCTHSPSDHATYTDGFKFPRLLRLPF